jgi:citrate lyase subunit beta/citryl-CoA lyase
MTSVIAHALHRAASARTWLFVPGDRPERFAKAAASGADVIVLDLEDAVAPDYKAAALAHVTDWLPDTDCLTAVRINAVGTPWHEVELAALAGTSAPVLVMLAKAEEPDHVATVVRTLPSGSAVVALVETALGVLQATAIARVDGVCRLALGSYDLAAELGVDPDHAPAIDPARSALAFASAAAHIAGPIDGVTGDVHNSVGVTADVTRSAALGFAGKLCIHPSQVAPASAALAPSAQDLAWAARILDAADAARAADRGVVVVDGRMVDAPVIARAQRIADAVSP